MWKEKLGEELWDRLEKLLDYFGRNGTLTISNHLCLAESQPLIAIEFFESCQEIIELEEEIEPTPIDKSESLRRTKRLCELIRTTLAHPRR
ncbi:MAG: hypothetical protein NTY30_04720 [Candidatus Berkelbacteria bacterium]|nr:hypothetical protein [Candidatus Berkelbacteria bacterium]